MMTGKFPKEYTSKQQFCSVDVQHSLLPELADPERTQKQVN